MGASPAAIGSSPGPAVSSESAAQAERHLEEAKRIKHFGKTQEAIVHAQQAMALNPNNAMAYAMYGDLMVITNRLTDAISAYIQALTLNPGWHAVRMSLAVVYKSAERHEEALETARQALALTPMSAQALETIIQIQFFMCDWTDYDKLIRDLQIAVDKQIAEGKVPTLTPWHCSTYPLDPQFVKRLSRAHAEAVVASTQSLQCPPLQHPPRAPLRPGERLRIGYVSSEFNDHPVSHLMGSVFSFHDRSRYEVFCYSIRASDGSQWRKRVEDTVEHFVEVSSWDTAQIAKRISDDRIHIAINLNGWTKSDRNQVFALRCAPLQIQFLGFPATMCAPWIDYSVADTTVGPPEVRHCYGEPLALMPHSMIPTDHKQVHRDLLTSAPPPRSDLGIPENAVVYACSNQLFKLTPDLFATWCRILQRVPGSVLWMQRSPAAAEPRLRQEFAKYDLDPARLIFTDRCNKAEYMRRQGIGDIFLDTPIYNAYTTGADSFWSGVPMVTLPLDRMASRAAASLCNATGFGSEMITSSLQEYEARAVELGSDHAQRRSLRKRLSDARLTMPLYDTALWTRDFEHLMTALWDRHAAGLPPETLAVEPQAPTVPAAPLQPSRSYQEEADESEDDESEDDEPEQIEVPPVASAPSLQTVTTMPVRSSTPMQLPTQALPLQFRGMMPVQSPQMVPRAAMATPPLRYQYASRQPSASVTRGASVSVPVGPPIYGLPQSRVCGKSLTVPVSPVMAPLRL